MTYRSTESEPLDPLRPKVLSVTSVGEMSRPAGLPVPSSGAAHVTSTELGQRLFTTTGPNAAPAHESVLSEVEAIVVGQSEESLFIRLPEQNIVVTFPRFLFDNADCEVGRSLTYQIVQRPSRTRYQRFVRRVSDVDERRVEEVLSVLAEIPLRQK